jgi:hypothetical protein
MGPIPLGTKFKAKREEGEREKERGDEEEGRERTQEKDRENLDQMGRFERTMRWQEHRIQELQEQVTSLLMAAARPGALLTGTDRNRSRTGSGHRIGIDSIVMTGPGGIAIGGATGVGVGIAVGTGSVIGIGTGTGLGESTGTGGAIGTAQG